MKVVSLCLKSQYPEWIAFQIKLSCRSRVKDKAIKTSPSCLLSNENFNFFLPQFSTLSTPLPSSSLSTVAPAVAGALPVIPTDLQSI